MEKKNIFLTCLILAIFVASIGAAVAVTSDVNLPDGYELDESQSIPNQTVNFFGIEADSTHAVMVNGDKNITVDTFFPHTEVTLTPANGSVMKNISGKEGLYQEVDGRFNFVYSDNNQFVQISAPEENLIAEVIGE
jgi:hypothetical protein